MNFEDLSFNPFRDGWQSLPANEMFLPDDEIGRRYWEALLKWTAEKLGYSGDLADPRFLAKVRTLKFEAESAEKVVLEKVTRKCASREFDIAGKLYREHLLGGATAIAHSRAVAHLGPIVAKAQEGRSAGGKARAKTKASEHDDIADRYDALILVHKKHKIAGIIAGERGVDVSTVRKALKKTGRC